MVQKEMLKHVTLKSRICVLSENVRTLLFLLVSRVKLAVIALDVSSTIWQALRRIAHPTLVTRQPDVPFVIRTLC